MSRDLTILCVTAWRPYALTILHEHAALARDLDATMVRVDGRGAGYIEKVLDDAIAACPDGYILRLDDDETVTPELSKWLAEGGYRDAQHWAFPRLHLYPDAEHHITTEPLWPDLQTRLSLKRFSGGRPGVHQGSPYGTGEIGPAGIVHHKFLCRSLAERRACVDRYESIRPGAGRDFAVFSVPEDFPNLKWEPLP